MSSTEETHYQSGYKKEKRILSMDLISQEEMENKRVLVENPRYFFELIKKSPQHDSWKSLVKKIGCSSTTLKCCRRGKRTINGKFFVKLLDYLTEKQREQIYSDVKFFDLNWGSRKGGNQFVKNMKNRLGEEGFLKHLENVRGKGISSSLAIWHKKMKKENPEFYSQIQRKRWATLMNFWRTDEKIIKKRIKRLKTKFGNDYFSKLGLKTVENQPLTKREELVRKEISNLGFELEAHKTILNHNFDFAYKKEGELKAIEEVLGFKKKKSHLFYEILVLYLKYKDLTSKYNVPFFISAWYEVDLKYKRERLPLELFLWSFEKGMIPILMDITDFNNTRKEVLAGNYSKKAELLEFIKSNLKRRANLLVRGATSQLKQPFDDLEQIMDKKINLLGLNPQGKKLLETRFGPFTVTDNFFKLNGEEFAVFVSNTDIEGVIGSSAILKELVSSKIKTVGILFNPNKRTLKSVAQRALLNSYVDYFYDSLEGFEKDFGLLDQFG